MTTTPSPEALADQIERGLEEFHDSLPDQGETGDPTKGKALCQLFYDHSEIIIAALRPTPTQGDEWAARDLARAIRMKVTEGSWREGELIAMCMDALRDHRLAFSRPEPVGAGIAAALQAIADLPTARSEEMMEGEERAYRAVQALATPSHLPPAEPNEGPSKEWCLRMAELEGDAKIGAGMPDHPLRDISPQGCQAESALIVAHGLLRSYSGTASDAGDAFKVLDAALRALPASGETARIEPVGDEALVERVALQREAQKLRDHFRAYPVGYVTRHDLSGLFSALDRAAIQAIPAPATDAGQSADSLVEYIRRAIASFEQDPPATDFQRGYLAALRNCLPKSPSAGEEPSHDQ